MLTARFQFHAGLETLVPAPPAPDPHAEAADLARRLSAYPYHSVLKGFGGEADGERLKALARALAALPGPDGRGADDEKISFTRVRVNPDSSGRKGASTRLSRTSAPLPAHTDSSYAGAPHALVAFHMLRADPEGGESVVIAARDAADALTETQRRLLRQPVFPFGKRLRPVLWGKDGDECIRYYRVQIEAGLAEGATLSPAHQATIDALDTILDDPDMGTRFRLEDGDVLALNNLKALHGRTGFASDSPRLMHRLRAHAPVLD